MQRKPRIRRWLLLPIILFFVTPLSCRQGAALSSEVLSDKDKFLIVISRVDNLWVGVPASFPVAFFFGWPGAKQNHWVEIYEIKRGEIHNQKVESSSFCGFAYIKKRMEMKIFKEENENCYLMRFGEKPANVGRYFPQEFLPPASYKIINSLQTLKTSNDKSEIVLEENGLKYHLKMRGWSSSSQTGLRFTLADQFGVTLIKQEMGNALKLESPLSYWSQS